MRARAAVIVAAAAAAGSILPAVAAADGDGSATVARGAALVRSAECGRCHEVVGLGIEPAARDKSCAGCHAWIRGTRDDAAARAREARTFPLWDRYVANVHSYLAVPDLAGAGARLDPAWVSGFLRAPHKIRPGFPETMIRTPFSAAEADAVAAFLRAGAARPVGRPMAGIAAEAARVPVSSRPDDVADGARLYAKLQCGKCHAFGARPATPGIAEAPDLAHARRRMRPADVAAFIADPAAFAGGGGGASKMPSYGLGARDAARLRDFLLAAPVGPTATTVALTATAAAAATAAPAAPTTPTRRATFAEVNRRVLAPVCSHCHSDGKLTDGDGGPGNTGGLGYAGAGVDLGSWRGLLRGARRPGGRRVSLLEPAPGEAEAPLLARLLRRVEEHAAEHAGGAEMKLPPGMPLGQPPLDDARLELVRAWLADGAPGPDGRRTIRARPRRD